MKYKVSLEEVFHYTVLVDADNKEAASERAKMLVEEGADSDSNSFKILAADEYSPACYAIQNWAEVLNLVSGNMLKIALEEALLSEKDGCVQVLFDSRFACEYAKANRDQIAKAVSDIAGETVPVKIVFSEETGPRADSFAKAAAEASAEHENKCARETVEKAVIGRSGICRPDAPCYIYVDGCFLLP